MAISGNQRQSVAIDETHLLEGYMGAPSVAISGNQRQSESIDETHLLEGYMGSHGWPSVVISGNQWQLTRLTCSRGTWAPMGGHRSCARRHEASDRQWTPSREIRHRLARDGGARLR